MLAVATLTFVSCKNDDDSGETPFTIDPNNFQGHVPEGKDLILDANTTYYLTGALIVDGGATLTVPAGTVIKASGGTSAYIAIAQDGKIFVNGTVDKPVVMTSASATPASGNWGGLVICGRANTNKGGSTGQTATAEVSDLTYGGTKDDDNSGVIKYLRIEYTGATFSNDKEFNGLSLFGVGSGTVIDYVQSFHGGDDGMEFFGGTVSATHLVSTFSEDDSIDFADGWRGTGSYWYISGGSKAGIEGSNNGDNGDANPMTNTMVSNVTIVSPNGGTEGGIFVKEGGGKWDFTNVYISGYTTGIHVKNSTDDPFSNTRLTDGDIYFDNVQFSGVTSNTDYAGATSIFATGTATGAGNGGNVPTWAQGWTKGL